MKRLLLGAWLLAIPVIAAAQERPFGTLREQAARQQQWLKKRLETFLPALLRKHGIDMWVVPMREYNEDPVFSSKAKGITGTMYSHPIGLNGHGAGPLIGLWDYQDGVVGRGEARVIPSMWFSIELQATTPVPEWDGQPVQMAQEEDMIIGADGNNRWARQRQHELFLVRGAP